MFSRAFNSALLEATLSTNALIYQMLEYRRSVTLCTNILLIAQFITNIE